VITEDLVGFADRLRAAGMVVEVPRLEAAAEALIMAPWLALPTPYWPLRLTLCGRRADLTVFDAVYAGWSGEEAHDAQPVETGAPVDAANAVAATEAGRAAVKAAGVGGSDHHAPLAGRDLRTLTDTEKAQVAGLVARLKPVGRPRRVPQWVPDRSGRIDAARTVRLMIHNRGEPTRLQRRRRNVRPRRLVFFIDVSKSMAPYVDMFLLFAHAALVAGPGTTEVFTIGTRWTRVTAELAARHPQDAMRTVTAVENDWSQGTQLGRSLQSFLRRWSGHRAVRSSVVVMCTDGMEDDRDFDLLPRQVARLSRIAHRLIWVNPARRRPGFKPMPPLRNSLRYADEQLTGHTLDELYALVEAITR
jgi:uncharacterized protein